MGLPLAPTLPTTRPVTEEVGPENEQSLELGCAVQQARVHRIARPRLDAPKVPLRLGKNQLLGVLDTGADVTICTREVAQRAIGADDLSEHYNKSQVRLTVANGGNLNVLGELEIPIEIKGTHITHMPVVVVENGVAPLLLGNDFILNRVTNVKGKHLEIDADSGQVVKLPIHYNNSGHLPPKEEANVCYIEQMTLGKEASDSPTQRVIVKHTRTIPPYHITLVKVDIETSNELDCEQEWAIGPLDSESDSALNVTAEEAVVSKEKDGSYLIAVTNETDEFQVIKSGTHVGNATTVVRTSNCLYVEGTPSYCKHIRRVV